MAPAWTPLPPDELALKDCPNYPGCPAMVLYRESYTDDVHSFETQSYRIKVFNDEGKKYADVEIPYLDKSTQVEEIRARTVKPDGTPLEFHGEIFDKVIVKSKRLKVQAKVFTLPAVEAGSIVEYSYKVRWREGPPDVLRHPTSYIITRLLTFPTAHWVLSHELFVRRQRFSINPIPGANFGASGHNLPAGMKAERRPDGTVVLEAENLPPYQEEDFMLPEPEVQIRLDFYYVVGGVAPPGDYYWRDQVHSRGESLEKFIGKSNALQHEVERIVSPQDAPETKLRKLYDRAQQIRYLSFEHARTEKEQKREDLKENNNVKDVLKHGFAASNEINFLFVALCRAAGFEASVVSVASRNGKFFSRDLPDSTQLNAIVVRVRVAAQDYYFDPATLYCPFKMLPWEETSAGGVVLAGEKESSLHKSTEAYERLDSSGKPKREDDVFVTTPTPLSSDAVIGRHAKLHLEPNGSLGGEVHVTFTGQEALRVRLNNHEKDEAGRRKALEDEVKEWLPVGARVELKMAPAWESSSATLDADLSVIIPDFATSTGRRLLLPPAVFQASKKYPFQTGHRIHPVYFRYPYQVVDDITIQPPQGYQIESLPAARKEKMPFGHYEVDYQNQTGALHLHRQFVMDGILFQLKDYPALRVFFDKARAGDEQQVVLKAEEVPPKN